MEKSGSEKVKTRRRRRRTMSPLLLLLIGALIGGAIFAYTKYSDSLPPLPFGNEAVSPGENPPDNPAGEKTSTVQDYAAQPPATSAQIEKSETQEKLSADPTSEEQLVSQRIDEIAEQAQDGEIWAEKERALANIELFYSDLDADGYLVPLGLNSPSKDHFSRLIQNLLDNPPIVSGETDDLFNLLQNTAHFFRIVGKENIRLMKAILARERESFEEILADYYTLSQSPEQLQDAFAVQLKEEALYDYAGFFLNTMGGRLYLFRRDPLSRMVVSYYSILIIDEANISGNNRHGIDIRPAITMLINELENSGDRLKLKDTYLDSLYDLKEKYL